MRMICTQTALERLEYPRLKELLAGQTQSQPGRQEAAQLRPLAERRQVEQALTEVDEAVRLLTAGQVPPLGGCWDLAPLLEQAQAAGSLLPAESLQKVGQSLQVYQECRRWFHNWEELPQLFALAGQLQPLDELLRRLRESIGTRGELLDSASFALGDLRYQIRQLRSRIKQQLEQLLAGERYAGCFQERLVTVRNSRYVVPLKADCRGQLKGFVQDESASGQTLYLEPAQVLEGNNRLQQLQREEQREERRILLQPADLVRRDAGVLRANQQVIARLDLRLAAARLSRSYQGCRPELVTESLIELKQARHPLLMAVDGRLEPQRAVAIDLLLPAACRALVISGANTGGKSVALKTLGLLLLMVRSGLHIPCHPDSRLHLYEQLFVDIGDEQSIAASLSTFSGHLQRIRHILERADFATLVLLDEAGTGTDPAEGAALAQAVLDELVARGAKTLLTTHLSQLKVFAHGQPGMENAAVEFDPQTLEPRYRLRYGIPGASSAMATARRLGLPTKVLQRAEGYLGQGEQDSTALLTRLNRQQQQLDAELAQARQARQEAERSQALRREQLARLQEQKRAILGKATTRAEGLISATETHLKQLRKRQKGARSPQQAVSDRAQLAAAREELAPFQPKRRRPQSQPVDLQPGELVKISALGVEATVARVSGEQAELRVAGKRLRQPLSALEQYQPRRFAGGQAPVGQVTRELVERPFEPRLKLVGQRVEAALPQLERFIDDALLHNMRQVEIVHGSGEGILRRAVREFLAGQRGVSAFYAAPIDQGGDNITIAELGDR